MACETWYSCALDAVAIMYLPNVHVWHEIASLPLILAALTLGLVGIVICIIWRGICCNCRKKTLMICFWINHICFKSEHCKYQTVMWLKLALTGFESFLSNTFYWNCLDSKQSISPMGTALGKSTAWPEWWLKIYACGDFQDYQEEQPLLSSPQSVHCLISPNITRHLWSVS